MAGESRTRMIEGATRLLASKGLQETSFSEVLKLTGAPRGSIYHHFPEGKDQLVAAAVDHAGAIATALIERSAGQPARVVTANFLEAWRQVLLRSDFHAGCSVLAVTVATDSPQLLEHAASVFRTWRLRLGELLAEGGMTADEAQSFAALLVSGAEGAVVLSRAEHSIEPFELVSGRLLRLVGDPS
ncbi:MAG: TetR/AcrR family transcriptional regulator [Actinomycetota bacterium]